MRFFLPSLCVVLLAGAACQRTERGTATPSVPTSTTPPAPLRETRWELRRLASQPVTDDPTQGQQPYLLISDAGTISGQASCNRFQGTLQPVADDGELRFSPLQTTRMACPALATETLFTRALQNTQAYRIQGDTLWLYGNAGRTGTALARLEAVRNAR